MNQDTEDTIVAVATPPGRGGVGIVRLSGEQAVAIARTLLPEDLTLKPRRAHFAAFRDADGEVIDEGLVLWFPAPHSFTGQEVVEFQGHGGPVLLDQIVQTCIRGGARMAGAGEFSLRAFLHDRMDLAQAESIADLIDAGTQEAARAAMGSLQGAFSGEVNTLVQQLIELRVYVEAAIDFPDEEIDFLSEGGVVDRLDGLVDQTRSVLRTAEQGRLLREGMTLVIAGRPNAGKSSLLNELSGQDSAIVTEVAGTTRDVLREQIQLDGLPLHLVDTAGLRESPDQVEREGIKRAWREIEQADRLLIVVDDREWPGDQDLHALLPASETALPELSMPVTVARNKCDLSGTATGVTEESGQATVLTVSAKTGAGLAELRAHLKTVAGYREGAETRFSARRRHLASLEEALEWIRTGRGQLAEHNAGELLAEDLRQAQQALETITGRFTADDLLGHIFSSFCIGK
jgi:tRNA modification GTPase